MGSSLNAEYNDCLFVRAFDGKREVAEEERYFRQKEKEQMEALRKHHVEEIEHHKKEIERLQKEIDRHKGKIRKLNHDD